MGLSLNRVSKILLSLFHYLVMEVLRAFEIYIQGCFILVMFNTLKFLFFKCVISRAKVFFRSYGKNDPFQPAPLYMKILNAIKKCIQGYSAIVIYNVLRCWTFLKLGLDEVFGSHPLINIKTFGAVLILVAIFYSMANFFILEDLMKMAATLRAVEQPEKIRRPTRFPILLYALLCTVVYRDWTFSDDEWSSIWNVSFFGALEYGVSYALAEGHRRWNRFLGYEKETLPV